MKNEKTLTPEMLSLEQLKFLQDVVNQQLFWTEGKSLIKDLWTLLHFAMESDLMSMCERRERAGFLHTYEKLSIFFSELDKLGEPLADIRKREAQHRIKGA